MAQQLNPSQQQLSIFKGYNTSSISVPTGSWEEVPLNDSQFEEGGDYSHSPSSTRVTINTTGYYDIVANVRMGSAGSGRTLGEIRLGTGAVGFAGIPNSGVSGAPLNITAQAVYIEAGDTVHTRIYQNSGSTLDTLTMSPPTLSIRRVG